MSEQLENTQGAAPDLSGMLGQLLQNPQAMGQVMQMADTLRRAGGAGPAGNEGEGTPVRNADDGDRAAPAKRHDGGGLHGVSEADRTRLLQSLKPFLSDERQEKADTIIRIMGLLDAAGKMGLFPDQGNSR